MTQSVNASTRWLPVLDPDAYPVKRPEVICDQHDLFWGISQVRTLSSNERDFIEACVGDETFGNILKKLKLALTEIFPLSKFVVWWPEPIKKYANRFNECDTLIIASGMEMPWTGMGGRILAEAYNLKTHVITCFNDSQSGGEAIGSIDASYVVQRLSQASHEQWDLSWQHFSRRRNNQNPEESSPILEQLLSQAILRYKPKTIYAPAGLLKGTSSLALRASVLKLLGSGHFAGNVHLYDDLPASAGYVYVDELLKNFENSFLTPREYYLDVSKELTKKMMILDLFNGKISAWQYRNWLYSGVVNSQEIDDSATRFVERFWSIEFSINI